MRLSTRSRSPPRRSRWPSRPGAPDRVESPPALPAGARLGRRLLRRQPRAEPALGARVDHRRVARPTTCLSDLPFQVAVPPASCSRSRRRRRLGETSMSPSCRSRCCRCWRLWIGGAPARAGHPPRLPRRADRPAEPPAAAPAPRARLDDGRAPTTIRSRCSRRPRRLQGRQRHARPRPTGPPARATSPGRMRAAPGPRRPARAPRRRRVLAVLPGGPVRRRARPRRRPPPGVRAAGAVRGRRDPARRRASVGLACFPEHGSAPDELLRGADVALYVAKAAQRARSRSTPPARTNYTVDRLVLADPAAPRAGDGRASARVPAEVPVCAAAPPSASRRWPAGSTRRSGASAPTASSRSPSRPA